MLNTEEPAIAARREADEKVMEAALVGGAALSMHAYADGGMHPNFALCFKGLGPGELARKTSLTEVPISRAEAALADPHTPSE